ncbi:hypothetical protein WNZ15_22400 [Roseibium sp. AS2]|uniref:hypothetical protein n=1 Tax=Roseibium sp. AS2 TaxID=3135781 RepID=UPI00316EA4D8
MKLMDARRANSLSHTARETHARELFNPETIAGEIERAVSLGKTEIRMFQKVPVDLKETEAAQALTAKLAALGYAISWEQAAQKEEFGKRETMRFFQYRELVIAWG